MFSSSEDYLIGGIRAELVPGVTANALLRHQYDDSESLDPTDIVDVVWRDDDADGDDGSDTIGVADAVVDEVTNTVGPKVIGSGSRRTPPH
jgi:hypothetical protein